MKITGDKMTKLETAKEKILTAIISDSGQGSDDIKLLAEAYVMLVQSEWNPYQPPIPEATQQPNG